MEKLDNIHPGEVLLQEFMKPLEITAYRLSKDMGIPQCKREITMYSFWQLAMYSF
jgi:plasmid maintenance system antidote protein VapI